MQLGRWSGRDQYLCGEVVEIPSVFPAPCEFNQKNRGHLLLTESRHWLLCGGIYNECQTYIFHTALKEGLTGDKQ